MGDESQPRWRVFGETVRGASHARAGMPNQDAILYPQTTGGELPIILCVSDGHGGAKYFRSDEGANIAVATAEEVLREFLKNQPDINNLSIIKGLAEEKLPLALVRRWRERVDEHIAASPVSPDDLLALEKKNGEEARRVAEKHLPVAYGATLLAAVVAEEFILYMQLGDGDVLSVSDGGEVTTPLPRDDRLFANETTSLCSRDAWRDFRIGFQTLSGSPPALILLSTDGYANSFRDEAGFLKVGSDLLDMMRADGIKSVEENLEVWLAEASEAGSGDDITVGIICRTDAVGRRSEQQAPGAAPLEAEEIPQGTDPPMPETETKSTVPAGTLRDGEAQ